RAVLVPADVRGRAVHRPAGRLHPAGGDDLLVQGDQRGQVRQPARAGVLHGRRDRGRGEEGQGAGAVTLQVALVVPDRQLWSGQATTVIAKTTEGDIGVQTGHSPVFGILTEGSLVEIVTDETRVRAAVSGGFLSVADNKVSILAAQAQLG